MTYSNYNTPLYLGTELTVQGNYVELSILMRTTQTLEPEKPLRMPTESGLGHFPHVTSHVQVTVRRVTRFHILKILTDITFLTYRLLRNHRCDLSTYCVAGLEIHGMVNSKQKQLNLEEDKGHHFCSMAPFPPFPRCLYWSQLGISGLAQVSADVYIRGWGERLGQL